jgi:hypothetical protein
VTTDGKQFAVIKQASGATDANEASTQQVNVVLNWFEELKQRVPAK